MSTVERFNEMIDMILSDPDLGADFVKKYFLDENFNETDEQGNPIEEED